MSYTSSTVCCNHFMILMIFGFAFELIFKQMSDHSERMAGSEFDKKTATNDVENEDKYQIIEFCTFLYEYFEIARKWQAVQVFLEEHPVASVFLIVTTGMCAVPIVLFIIFVMTSVALSIMGVFLFEGTIIAIGTFILGGVLFFVGLFAMGFSLFLISCYYTLHMSGSIIAKLRDKLGIAFMSGDGVHSQVERDG